MAEEIFLYNDPLLNTFDPLKAEVAESQGRLILEDNALSYDQPFDSDVGFTFDSGKTEFVGGAVRQKNQLPSNINCGCRFDTNITLEEWSSGSITGTPTGGANVSGGKLDLNHSDNRRVDYQALNNADSIQAGCIRFRVTPNYSGVPLSDMWFFAISKAHNDSYNLISLRHSTSGPYLRLHMYDNSGILITEHLCGVWLPTLGQEYEFELNWNLTSGENRLFIDGIQSGTTSSSTGTRDSNIGLLRIGDRFQGGNISNFSIDDLLVFDAVQHTSNYAPGYTIPKTIYFEDVITLPTFVYPGVGTTQAFDSFVISELGLPRGVLNGQYWTGSAWAISDLSYAQANDQSTIDANIGSLAVSDTLIVKLVTPSSGVQAQADSLSVGYTGEAYPVDSPSIQRINVITHEGLLSFDSEIIVSGLDSVTFILTINGFLYYHDGASWVISDGTQAQSNTIAEIQASITDFPSTKGETTFIAFLNSADGSTNPKIVSVTIEYTFADTIPPVIDECVVWGYVKAGKGLPIASVEITATLNQENARYKDEINIRNFQKKTETRSDGYFRLPLPENENMTKGAFYSVNIGNDVFTIKVPNAVDANFFNIIQ